MSYLELFEKELTKTIESILPSVVNISTEQVSVYSFFGAVPLRGFASGLIVSEDGYIVTNFHVVKNARRILVTLSNGDNFEARYVGGVRNMDISVIKVSSHGLQPAKLGNSDELKIGQIVLALGNPFGLPGGPSVTLGTISAIGRIVYADKIRLDDLIQTDAAINPGNSGGPLVSIRGEVVGITTAVIPFAQGIGFAIPINNVRRILDDVKKFGRPRIPWMGIYGIDVTQAIAKEYKISISRGVLVVSTAKRSPAEIAGIKEGDVILAIDEKQINNFIDLRRTLLSKYPGESINLKILRDERIVELNLILGEEIHEEET